GLDVLMRSAAAIHRGVELDLQQARGEESGAAREQGLDRLGLEFPAEQLVGRGGVQVDHRSWLRMSSSICSVVHPWIGVWIWGTPLSAAGRREIGRASCRGRGVAR